MDNFCGKLKPCPFCGMHPPEDLIDTLYPTGTAWRELTEEGLEGLRHYFSYRDMKEGDGRCFAMHCAQNMGGCGAQIVGDSEAEAIMAWNRRPEGFMLVPTKEFQELEYWMDRSVDKGHLDDSDVFEPWEALNRARTTRI